MKKLLLLMLVLCMVFPLVSAAAEDDSMYGEICVEEEEEDIPYGPVDYLPAEPNPEATREDFIGEWKAVYRTVNGQMKYNTDSDECAAVTDQGVFFLGGYASTVINILSLRTFGGTVNAYFRDGAFSTGSEEDGLIKTELLQDNMLKVTILFGGEETVIYYERTETEDDQ